ncbi:UNVERIFIED_CONTAM: CRISPR-associated protein Cas2 [Acetivibrio alkalicellulosi]
MSRLLKKYLICYDISIDRKRRKVENILKDYGVRVQLSVFECLISSRDLIKLSEEFINITPYLSKADSIRIYEQCTHCERSFKSFGNDNGIRKLYKNGHIVI